MNKHSLLATVLDLFAEGGGTASGDGGTGAEGTAETTGEENTPAVTRPGKKGAYDNVIFGKQPEEEVSAADSQEADTSKAPRDLRAEFKNLVNGEYKDIYTEETQKIINNRFKNTKELEAKLAKQQGVLDILAQRYNVADGDMDKLQEAIDDDYNMWADAADKEGLSVDTYKQVFKIKQQNKSLLAENEERQRQEQANQQISEWVNQEAELKKTFPNFDLRTEIQNPQFAALLNAHVPVEHAFKVVHMDDIVSNAMKTTANLTEKRVADSVRAKGTRPNENGTTSQSAFTYKDDVTKLTKSDRAEIARRAARGEIISF